MLSEHSVKEFMEVIEKYREEKAVYLGKYRIVYKGKLTPRARGYAKAVGIDLIHTHTSNEA